MRYLGEQEVEDIAMGAAVMASGGGGNPYVGILIAKQCVADNGPIPLLTLDELPDDARVAVSMGLGAPTVLVEKVPAGPEPVYALEALEREVGIPSMRLFRLKRAAGTRCILCFLRRSATFRCSMPTAWAARSLNCKW